MILVFDSSVWISALQFGGVPLRSLDLATGQFRIAMCKPILSEIHAALKEKFNWRTAEIDDALAGYSLETIMVQLHGALQGACRDPNDDMILECAVLAGAEIVVTGDKDLLALNPFEKIQILTPRDFLSLLGPGESAAP